VRSFGGVWRWHSGIIYREVEDQVINLVGQANFTGIQVVPVQQQQKSSDCWVFAAAFATCLAYGIPPQTVEFDICKMRAHLYHSLRNGIHSIFSFISFSSNSDQLPRGLSLVV